MDDFEGSGTAVKDGIGMVLKLKAEQLKAEENPDPVSVRVFIPELPVNAQAKTAGAYSFMKSAIRFVLG